MQTYSYLPEGYTGECVYVVMSTESYDSWDVSYHKTKKGAYKWIMNAMYQRWEYYRYIGGWAEMHEPDYSIGVKALQS